MMFHESYWRYHKGIVPVVLFCGALMVQPIQAAEGTQMSPYRFVEAFRDALSHDARLALVEIQLTAQSEQITQAESQLGVQANVTGMAGWQSYMRQGMSSPTEQTTSNQTLTVSKPLYAPRQEALLAQSLIRVDYAKLNLASKRIELAVRVVEGYLNLLMAQESRRLSQFQLETAVKHLTQVDESLKLGYSSKVDLFSVKAEVDDMKARVLADDLAIQTQRQNLEQMIGRSLPPHLPMLQLNEDRLFSRFLARQDWLSLARDNNLDLSLSTIASDLARKELETRSAEGKPQVQMGVQYGQIQGGSSYTTGENQYVYLQASMPLYDSGYHESRQREAQSLIQASEQETRIKSLEIDQKVQALLANLTSSKERIGALRQAIASGEVYLELSEESYQLGLRNLLDVQRAKEKLYANQRDMLKTSISMVSYLVQLYAVTAELDEAWIGALSQVLWK